MIRRFALAALLALTACVAASPLPARAQTFLESTTPPLETKLERPPPPRQPSRNFVLGSDLNIVNGALVELRSAFNGAGLGPLPACAAGEYLTAHGAGFVCSSDVFVTATGTTTPRALRDRFPEFDPKDFGAACDAARDDTTEIQNAANAAGAVQGVLKLTGMCRHTSPIVPPQGITIEGLGPKFGAGLRSDGCATFTILGAGRAGGWAFRVYARDFIITPVNTPPGTKLIEINNAYSIHFEHVWVYTVADNGSIAFDITNANDVMLDKVVIYGEGNTTSKGVVTFGTSWVRIINPDFEVLNHAVENNSSEGAIDIWAPYMERNVVGVANYAGAGSQVTVLGGVIAGVNTSTIPIANYAATSNTVAIGTRLPTGTGVVPFYAPAGWDTFFYDSLTKRVQIGATAAEGAVSPAFALTLNAAAIRGPEYGFGLGDFVQYIGAPDAFDHDWNFWWKGTGDKTARFFGTGGNALNLFTDGSFEAVGSVSAGTSLTLAGGPPITSIAGASCPAGGTHALGEIQFFRAPVAGGKLGCVCVAAGTPGDWKPFGAIDP